MADDYREQIAALPVEDSVRLGLRLDELTRDLAQAQAAQATKAQHEVRAVPPLEELERRLREGQETDEERAARARAARLAERAAAVRAFAPLVAEASRKERELGEYARYVAGVTERQKLARAPEQAGFLRAHHLDAACERFLRTMDAGPEGAVAQLRRVQQRLTTLPDDDPAWRMANALDHLRDWAERLLYVEPEQVRACYAEIVEHEHAVRQAIQRQGPQPDIEMVPPAPPKLRAVSKAKSSLSDGGR